MWWKSRLAAAAGKGQHRHYRENQFNGPHQGQAQPRGDALRAAAAATTRAAATAKDTEALLAAPKARMAVLLFRRCPGHAQDRGHVRHHFGPTASSPWPSTRINELPTDHLAEMGFVSGSGANESGQLATRLGARLLDR